MKFAKSILKNPFLLLALFGLLVVSSCQKEDLALAETQMTEETQDALALEKMILELNFGLPTQELSDEMIRDLYEERMAALPEETCNQLIAIVERGLAQEVVPAEGGPAVSFRTTESFLTNGIPDDGFGQSVEVTHNRVYVGAAGEQKVYEYAKFRDYTVVNEITPGEASDDFGYHVSVSGDWMAVSAPDFGAPFGRPGKVFVFQRQGASWVQHSVLTGPAGEFNFGGQGMALRGNKLAIVSSAGGFPSPGGTISVYELNGNNWTLEGTIHRPGYDWFGMDLDESGTRIVGTGSVNNFIGIVRASVFVHGRSGWTLEDEVIVPSPTPFAYAVPRDVAIQGNTVVLTALLPGTKQWVLTRNGSDWSLAQELNHGGFPFTNRFTEIQGNKIVIGADSPQDFFPDQVHVFENSGSSWNYAETLTPSDGGVSARLWGISVHGDVIAAGLPGLSAPGKVYVFE